MPHEFYAVLCGYYILYLGIATICLVMSSSISLQIPCLTETLARVRVRFSPPPPPPPGVTIYNRARNCCNLSARAVNSPISELQISAASDVVKEFYDGINRRDLAAVEGLIGEGCVYEDLVFSHPFVGRKATIEFFKKFSESISKDLQFVIDDISNEDSLAVGVTWHLEWKGRPFPFSKGCSFYRLEVLDGKKQIIYGRDCVEPATKPGETALVLIRGVTWLLEKFPQLADRL